MSDANRALALRAKPASGLVASRFDHGEVSRLRGSIILALQALNRGNEWGLRWHLNDALSPNKGTDQ